GRTDVYALGVIAYELFLGRAPFLAKKPAEVMYMHVNEAPPSPSSLSAGFPTALERLLLIMLSKDAAPRPSLAEERATLSAVRTVLTSAVEPQVPTEAMECHLGVARPFAAPTPAAPSPARALRRPSSTARRLAKPRSTPAPAVDDAAVDPFGSER